MFYAQLSYRAVKMSLWAQRRFDSILAAERLRRKAGQESTQSISVRSTFTMFGRVFLIPTLPWQKSDRVISSSTLPEPSASSSLMNCGEFSNLTLPHSSSPPTGATPALMGIPPISGPPCLNGGRSTYTRNGGPLMPPTSHSHATSIT